MVVMVDQVEVELVIALVVLVEAVIPLQQLLRKVQMVEVHLVVLHVRQVQVEVEQLLLVLQVVIHHLQQVLLLQEQRVQQLKLVEVL
tara:strand:+ start:162 stop:422 length:261 start_codon:yes stop_codon:yes gene_type:complete